MKALKLLALAPLLLTVHSFAKVFSEENIKNCKKIAIVAGTYDPFTYGHEYMGKAIIEKLPFDCVVYLPTQDPPHKIASPFQTRYEMLEAALKDKPNYFYPAQEDTKLSPKAYVEKLKTLGQQKEVFAVLGSDLSPQTKMYYINEFRLGPDGYIVTGRGAGEKVEIADAFKNKPLHVVEVPESYSSTQARKWFVQNDDVYFAKDVPAERYPNDILNPEVSKYIKENGLYLGTDGVTTRSPARILKTAVTSGLDKVGLFHPLREILVNKNKQDVLTEIVIDGKTYPLKKHLGSGLTADAYIFEFEGQNHVIKIANDRPRSGFAIAQDVKIGQWLNQKTSIKVPDVQAMDPQGKWKITTLVGGESLGDYLQKNNGYIEPHIEKQLRQAVDDMIKLSKKTNIKLDLSVDNLKIWNGKVYLIDAGPIPADVKHPMSYDEFTKRWSGHTKVAINRKCSNALKVFLARNQVTP
ncbi:hypothetical protein [Peredibacter starrii]|uniref:nicotinate-nucleotide adenylyltransferase n=1 Tax=Peredibacter starrii TaxID=28202 RepID=A0AAX4HSV0_9BACT|nr:hypothetical protein [Peredibacter starrii]WPU65994.1 hypothetical protein SOO65_04480 [Peredibacter starrii]